jgi:hypothetical protein
MLYPLGKILSSNDLSESISGGLTCFDHDHTMIYENLSMIYHFCPPFSGIPQFWTSTQHAFETLWVWIWGMSELKDVDQMSAITNYSKM